MADAGLIAACGSRRAVLERLLECLHEKQPVVLALVVATEGSTYRKTGALALIEADGRKTGMLSGGCLENELRERALAALQLGRCEWLVYDSLDDADLLFGSGTGCRGRSRVLLWPLKGVDAAAWLAAIGSWLASARAIEISLDPGSSSPAPVLIGTTLVGSGAAWLEPTSADCLTLAPPPRIWIIGAGPELPPLLSWLRCAGWIVCVSEHRQSWRDSTDLALADRVLSARPGVAAQHALPARVLLVMSHSAETDLQALKLAAQRPELEAIGLLGPPRRRDELLAQLAAEQVASLAPRMAAPVGLRLGGEGPVSIALAIAAWLQQRFPAA